MSSPLALHTTQAQGIVDIPGLGALITSGNTVPTDGAAGYATGCIFMNTSGSTINTVTYVNVGNSVSCNFDPLKG